MIKEQLTSEEIIKINELSKNLYVGATGAYAGLETMRLLTMNLKLECGRLSQLIKDLAKDGESKAQVEKHLGDVAALNEVGGILERAITEIEAATQGGKDISKYIRDIVNE